MTTCYVQYIITDRYFYQNKWKNTQVYKKKRHHIDSPYSRLISIFKTNYCITWQEIKAYLQPGVPLEQGTYRYHATWARQLPDRGPPSRGLPEAGLRSPWPSYRVDPGVIINIENTYICGFQSCCIFLPAIFSWFPIFSQGIVGASHTWSVLSFFECAHRKSKF